MKKWIFKTRATGDSPPSLSGKCHKLFFGSIPIIEFQLIVPSHICCQQTVESYLRHTNGNYKIGSATIPTRIIVWIEAHYWWEWVKIWIRPCLIWTHTDSYKIKTRKCVLYCPSNKWSEFLQNNLLISSLFGKRQCIQSINLSLNTLL